MDVGKSYETSAWLHQESWRSAPSPLIGPIIQLRPTSTLQDKQWNWRKSLMVLFLFSKGLYPGTADCDNKNLADVKQMCGVFAVREGWTFQNISTWSPPLQAPQGISRWSVCLNNSAWKDRERVKKKKKRNNAAYSQFDWDIKNLPVEHFLLPGIQIYALICFWLKGHAITCISMPEKSPLMNY